MEEIGNKWKTLTNEQQISLAQTMAGQRQYSNLIALFDNFDKYQSALNTAQNAGGKLQEQQDIYMDRLSTHVQQLTTATEHMWMGLVDTDGFKDVIDGLTTIVEKVDKLFQSIGGGKNLLQSLIPIVMSLTSKTVASGINTMIMNSQLEKRQLRDQRSSQVSA
jgi:TP901 family phage tail tape measure protein